MRKGLVSIAVALLVMGCGGGGSKSKSPSKPPVKQIDIKKEVVKDNKLPIAKISNISNNSVFEEGMSIDLDGSLSSDSDGKILKYEWYDNAILVSDKEQFSTSPLSKGGHSITLKVTDDKGGIDKTSVSVYIKSTENSSVNNAPEAMPLSVIVDKNKAINITLESRDVDRDYLSYSIVTEPKHGVISGVAPNLVYTPYNDYVGEDTIVYKVSDGRLNSNDAIVNITVEDNNIVDSSLATVYDGRVVTNDGQSVFIDLSNFADHGSSTITSPITISMPMWTEYNVITGPKFGKLTGTPPNLIYTSFDFIGEDSFVFEVVDLNGKSRTATIYIDVQEGNYDGYYYAVESQNDAQEQCASDDAYLPSLYDLKQINDGILDYIAYWTSSSADKVYIPRTYNFIDANQCAEGDMNAPCQLISIHCIHNDNYELIKEFDGPLFIE